MNLGIGENNIYYAIANFAVMMIVQIVYELLELSATGTWPEPFEIYRVFLTSVATTATFYGINKARKSE